MRHLRFRRGVLAFPLLSLLSLVLADCRARDPAVMTSALWREDLRFLEKELLKRHAAPFRFVTEVAFRSAVGQLEARLPSLSDAAVQVEFGRLVAMLHDGHTELWLAREGIGFRNLPVGLYDYGDDIRVRVASEPLRHLLGAHVVAIEGTEVEAVHTLIDPLIARDNDVEPLLSIPVYMAVPEILFGLGIVASADTVTFSFELEGKRSEERLPAIPAAQAGDISWIRARDNSPVPLYLTNPGRQYWFQMLDESRTLYVSYSRSLDQDGQPSIKRWARELFSVFDAGGIDRIVFDLRANRGGNYEKSQPLVDGIQARSARLGKGRLYVITGRETFSAGMVTTLQLQQRAGAILVGEPGRSRPNGSDNYEWFFLPHSKLRVDYTDRVKERAPEYADSDILPVDLFVTNSFEDYRDGRDRVLEAILEAPSAESPQLQRMK